jgi:hypothetical protein
MTQVLSFFITNLTGLIVKRVMKEVGVFDEHDLWISLLSCIGFGFLNEKNHNDKKLVVCLIIWLNPHPKQ